VNPNDVGLEIGNFIAPFIGMLIGIIIALWIKDFATKVAAGMSFKYFGPFKEGDIVQLDGKKAMVIKIGLMMWGTTVLALISICLFVTSDIVKQIAFVLLIAELFDVFAFLCLNPSIYKIFGK